MSTVLTQMIQPQSTVLSSSVPWVPGSTAVSATGLLADADVNNPALACTFAIAASYDGGLTFARKSIATWIGAGNPPSSLPPNLFWKPSAAELPTHVRVEIDLPQPLSIGADITLS